MLPCLFDRFPVELLYAIFDYLWAHEIYYAFSNLSEYIRDVLISYHRYSINFRSVRKTQFDLTCQFIRPDQVISLTLTDFDDTPDQCILFLSKFSIEQFVNLRSFEMNSFNENTFEQLKNLAKLKHLSSLHLPSRLWHSIPFKPWIRDVLPQIHGLVADDCIFEYPLNRLRDLKLFRCHSSEIKNLFNNILNVHTLDITLVDYVSLHWPRDTLSLTNLRRFFLKTEGMMTIVEIKDILHTMPSLKHLELDIEWGIDLIDGRRWELIISHLIRFDFRFRRRYTFAEDLSKTNVLDSFRSPFWLDYKRWFVAYDDYEFENIFTIPRFAPKDIKWPPKRRLPESTMSHFSGNEYIECLNLSSVFKRRETMGSLDLLDFIRDKPRLYSLNVMDSSGFNLLPKNVVYQQIRTVRFSQTCSSHAWIDPKYICTIFPRLESLSIQVESRQALRIFIDQLEYLLFAHFHLNSDVSKWCCWQRAPVTRRWLINNTRRLSRNRNFISTITNHSIRLWMADKQKSTSVFRRLFKSNSNRCVV